MIAGKDAQTAGIDRQRLMHAELCGKVRRQHRHVGVRLAKPSLLIQMLRERLIHAELMGEEPFVFGGLLQPPLGDRPKQPHRVVVNLFPQLPVEATE